MHVLIVDQCSASKALEGDVDSADLEDLNEATAAPDNSERIEAGDLYTGKQQRRIGSAVRTLRQNGHDADRYFVSAGFGLVAETDRLPHYDETFSSMSDGEIRRRGEELGITEDLLDCLEESYDLVILALGADYYRSIDLDRVLESVTETPVVLFNREGDEESRENVLSIPARTEQARENGSTVVGLKGTYLKRFASQLGEDATDLDLDQIRAFCTESDTSPTAVDDF